MTDVPEAGLAGEKNGRLLTLAETAGFHVFLSIDKGLKYQQNMTGRKIAVLIVKCKSTVLQTLCRTYRSVSQSWPLFSREK